MKRVRGRVIKMELCPEINREYQRWVAHAPNPDPYIDSKSLGFGEVLKAHFLIADYFYKEDTELGGVGPRDIALLHSALSRQHVGFGNTRKWPEDMQIASTLFFGLIKDHPFHDANKRTALLCLLYHLLKFGKVPTVNQKALEDFTVIIAEGDYRNRQSFKNLHQYQDRADILYITRFLARNIRNVDNRFYSVTYRQLNIILRSFGFELQNPSNNFIDVVRIRQRAKVFGMNLPIERTNVKVTQIGFPDWGAQVGAGAISTVRRATKLRVEDGIDSATFFHGREPILALIERYKDPLRSLANR